MRFAHAIFALVMKIGGPGLLVVGILDSSFLFVPWSNDLLIIAMTAREPNIRDMIYYAVMSTIGSVLGCLLIDLTLRPVGAEGLRKHLSEQRLKRVRRKIEQNAALALAVASLAPPPFPFTVFVMGAAALQYPRARLLSIVGLTRLVRFLLAGGLALRFGESILKWGRNPVAQGVMIGLIAFSLAGSVVSVYGWIQRSRSVRHSRASVRS
jgi:membrane protein YqaA with SNARE-associated domain